MVHSSENGKASGQGGAQVEICERCGRPRDRRCADGVVSVGRNEGSFAVCPQLKEAEAQERVGMARPCPLGEECPECGGAGLVRHDPMVGPPRRRGGAQPCDDPEELREMLSGRARSKRNGSS